MQRLVASLLIVLVFFAPRIARACQCARSERVEEARERAEAVFEVDIGEGGRGRVLRVWKGDVPRAIEVRPGDCPPTPDHGRWLVYGYDGGGIWHANMCGRSRPIESASEDLAFLGASSPPTEEPPAPRARTGDPMAGPPLSGGPPSEPPRPSSCACRTAAARGSSDAVIAALAIAAVSARRRATRDTMTG